MARKLGMGRLGMVALDSTRIRAQASRDGIDTEQRLRNERAKIRRQIRRWQKACDASDPDEAQGRECGSRNWSDDWRSCRGA